MKITHILNTLLILLGIHANGISQQLKEQVHKTNIQTVKIHKQDEPLTIPVIQLNSGEKITLSFDDLEGDIKTYSYKIVHCTAGWESSGLTEHEYLSGQFTGEIRDYRSSFNTLIPYTHYELDIPNSEMAPVISGNYMLFVFQNYNESDTVLSRKFRVTENIARISPEMFSFNKMSAERPNQQLEISVLTGSLFISNPSSEIKINIQKNYHNERYIREIDPSSITGNTLTYRNIRQMAFKGGNEFRFFNSKSTDYASENIAGIDYIRNNFHFRLQADQDLSFSGYKPQQEINGRFRVDKERVDDPAVEADYVYVYFTLKDESPELEGGVYVTGAFNNWQINEKNKMQYNMQQQAYEKRMLLKQGYYNYRYVLENYSGRDPYFYSGNYHQAENDYLIYIYYKDFSKGYDRLIGNTVFNSSSIQY